MVSPMCNICIVHGPNLNALGKRQPEIYGNITQEQLVSDLRSRYPHLNISLFQSGSESELVNYIHQIKGEGILINAGAYSHTSIAIADAIRSVDVPAISVHISNIYQRENFRHQDLIGEACKGSIVGLGLEGYGLAIECLVDLIAAQK